MVVDWVAGCPWNGWPNGVEYAGIAIPLTEIYAKLEFLED